MGKQMIFNYINIFSNVLRNGVIGLLGSFLLNQAVEEIIYRVYVFIRIYIVYIKKGGVSKFDEIACL